MALKDYWHLFRKWFWLILLAGVVAGAGAYWLNPPRYQSRVLIAVGDYMRSPSPDRNDILAGIQLAETYAVIATTPDVLRPATQAAGVRVENSSRQIEATVIPDTSILAIGVTHEDPALAVRLANEIASELMSRSPALQVLEWARLPAMSASPTRSEAVIIGAAISMVLVAGVILLRNYLDESIRDADEATRVLALPVVGTISETRRRSGTQEVELARAKYDPRMAEQFRSLRTNLLRGAGESDGQVFLITSAMPREGKSTVAANLAVSMAHGNRRVLLIDGDLRCPALHTMFNLYNDRGLIDLLSMDPPKPDRRSRLIKQDPTLAAIIQQTALPNLRVITSGGTTTEPSTLIGSPQMEGWIQVLLVGKDVDVVVIDSPPVLPICDALDAASRLDASVLVVVQAGKTSREAVLALKERCQYLSLRLRGIIMNRVHDQAGAASDSYYSRYLQADMAQQEASPGEISAEGVPPRKLLIVTPDEELLEALPTQLSNDIYDVRTAMEGAAGFVTALEWKPDLIVLDVDLPDADGLEIGRRLRTTRATEHTPIIYVATSGSYEDVEGGFASGGVDYLVKPFDLRELVLRVEAHLRNELVHAAHDGR